MSPSLYFDLLWAVLIYKRNIDAGRMAVDAAVSPGSGFVGLPVEFRVVHIPSAFPGRPRTDAPITAYFRFRRRVGRTHGTGRLQSRL